MSEMTNVKTWSKTKVTGTGASNAIANNDLLYNIKTHLKTVGWSVVSSSDGSSNFGASDYWVAGTSIVHAVSGSNHSWIVLSNSSICTGYQLCIDFANATNNIVYMYVSVNGTGFTGGSLTARPTASDEVQLNINGNTWTSYTSGTSPSANIFTSSDYKATMIYLGPTTVRGCWLFFAPLLAPSWFTKPNVSLVNSGTCVYTNFDSVGEEWLTSNIGGVRVLSLLGTLIIGTTIALTTAGVAGASGDYGGTWPTSPMWILSINSSIPGFLGTVPDVWWLHSNATLALGDLFPGDGSGTQVVIGNFGQGNDGTALSL